MRLDMSSSARKYSLIRDEEQNVDCRSSSQRDGLFRLPWLRMLYQIILHAIALILALKLWHQSRTLGLSNCILPSEIPSAADAVQYEDLIFDPSGFSTSNNPPNTFEGPPSPATNHAWSQLFDVGMFVLNQDEYDQFGRPTAELVDRPGEYLVTLEVFHQLHCLDYLRVASHAATAGMHTHHEQESDWSKTKHLSHCVDYLRQVLMCHGDLTPITLERREGQPPYRPDFRIHHTCRNWNAIHEFAAKHNTSGYGVA